MPIKLLGLFSILLSTDLCIYYCVKGKVVEKSGKIRNKKILKCILTEYGRKTKAHFSILICNIILCVINSIDSIITAVNEEDPNFFIAIKIYFNSIKDNKLLVIIGIIFIIILTLIFMCLAYRSTEVKEDNDINGNRTLSVEQIDKEYISFSFPNNIDSASTLLLIAGDLSFLGSVPDISNLKNNKKNKCKKYLSDNSQNHQCCKDNSKFCKDNCCMEKSKQFKQLFELIKKGVKIRIICKRPLDIGDIQYKRCIGRLKSIYKENLSIKFFPEDTLGTGICVLGRVKSNGGIKELFWHWKVPDRPGYYTVPATLKDTTSENKTIIFLLKDVLWNYAKSDDEIIKKSIEEYKNSIEI